jgi:hypothetical protein
MNHRLKASVSCAPLPMERPIVWHVAPLRARIEASQDECDELVAGGRRARSWPFFEHYCVNGCVDSGDNERSPHCVVCRLVTSGQMLRIVVRCSSRWWPS